MEKKEISARTTVKAIITGFVSYGIIINFLCLLIIAIGNYFLKNVPGSTARGLYITLPLMAVIIIYFIIHIICRLSTYDVFKKCKTNPDNYKNIIKYINIFFIVCIFLSIILFLGLLNLNLQYQAKSIDYAVLKYNEIFSVEHTNQLKEEMLSTFNSSKENLTTSTIILELGFAISFLSLIPYQRKMILKYNDF
ncbi:MAG TPA: hypothetical protein IAD08_02995 [Candidatus Scatovivens faecipullorum]|nr:hypothetical protein [Candidatus Scatovivens faecipullorum]